VGALVPLACACTSANDFQSTTAVGLEGLHVALQSDSRQEREHPTTDTTSLDSVESGEQQRQIWTGREHQGLGIATLRPLPHPLFSSHGRGGSAGGSIFRNEMMMMMMLRPFVTDSRTVAGGTVYCVDPTRSC
jgi:hypothetical protein